MNYKFGQQCPVDSELCSLKMSVGLQYGFFLIKAQKHRSLLPDNAAGGRPWPPVPLWPPSLTLVPTTMRPALLLLALTFAITAEVTFIL